ncbi:hypothetical protein NQ156_13270 [Microbacterium sp. zg.Y625]|uniref:hypothetical protein n=1 Tax=Microbacterium jiangjiandongii TaxID=3049071 RepID=UPI00214AD811|nr:MULTISPECIES: hypothetical protein [unclassified Microbacterium]MCR2794039.1 hypothetical protein [Microbacterium sp. zg.Y625]WIM25753.1 hypothetical protein QNO14_01495 [Microbacterium sp. zg-Y625]
MRPSASRLAAARPLVTFGALSHLVLAVPVVTFTTDVVLAHVAVLFAAFALSTPW